ncbi:hypothetical protein ACH5RR_013522 [Cinchona calisaya]|uniref:Protein kinase domain-containing protein n=1 Tax=Cinchona calisaya TaxID=153742 RepID=A0ABD3A3M9_9GENT
MAPKRQRTLVNQVQEEEEDAYVEEENLSDHDMNQPIGELRDGARRHQRQPRLNVHMPPVDYGVITAAVAMALRQVENEVDIKRKVGEESNKKMRFLAPHGQVKQHSTTFRPDKSGDLKKKMNARVCAMTEEEADGSDDVVTGVYDGKKVVIKVFDLSGEDQKSILWNKLDQPNVAKFIGATKGITDLTIKKSCTPRKGCCMAAEFLQGGTLRSYLRKNRFKKLLFHIVIRLALDVARGLCYLHSQKIVHRMSSL